MSRSIRLRGVFLTCSLFIAPSFACAQGFGGFGGAGNFSEQRGLGNNSSNQWSPFGIPYPSQAEVILNYITIDGTADIRVQPEGIRVVFAVTSEAETAEGCQEKIAAQIQAVRKAWIDLNIPEEDIVEDFINVLPRYEWRLIERDEQEIRIQQREGYRMQSNLHLSVKTEQDAMVAINASFKQGVTDIVTFDYWSSKLDEEKVKARAAAVEAAKEKANTLLALFEAPPKLINVQESTQVFYPHSLYQTYENVLEEEISHLPETWRRIPALKAYRPKMTFLQGLQANSDDRPARPAMKPEIAVVSSVRIYYQSPADKTVVGKSN